MQIQMMLNPLWMTFITKIMKMMNTMTILIYIMMGDMRKNSIVKKLKQKKKESYNYRR